MRSNIRLAHQCFVVRSVAEMLRPVGLIVAVLTTVYASSALLICTAQAQTFQVIHNFQPQWFSNETDGAQPVAGLTMDAAGNLYGTAFLGGDYGGICTRFTWGCGIAFEMSKQGSGWSYNLIHFFPENQGGNDGAGPKAGFTLGSDGAIYTTTYYGGLIGGCLYGDTGCGAVVNLMPPPNPCVTEKCSWNETVIYTFGAEGDGNTPDTGNLVFDGQGNMYGSTALGGSGSQDCASEGCGTVYRLSPAEHGWSETVIYSFTGGIDGRIPSGGVIVDQHGNLYGVTPTGGAYGVGNVYALYKSAAGWTQAVIYSFQDGSDGAYPLSGLILDRVGNLYGTTSGGNPGGSVFMLSPSVGGWTFRLLHSFTRPGYGPYGKLTMDRTGNLYGTTDGEGTYGHGNVFKLTRLTATTWIYSSLYDFTGGDDGWAPQGNVTVGSNGNVYGTTSAGGQYGHGVVWEITP